MRISMVVMALAFSTGFAQAGTVEVRPDAPVAEFTIPDSWETSHVNRGIQAISKDGEVDFWIEAYTPAEFDKLVSEHDVYWKDHDVAFGARDSETRQMNGATVTMTNEHATWKGKPTVIYYLDYHLGLPSKTNLVFTYWASPGGDDSFRQEVAEALGTMKVTEK